MKRFLPITALAVFAYPAATISCQNGQGAANPQIFWDGGAIPDPVFRTYVLENFDTDRDGKISSEEADAVLVIDLGREEPTDTPGIKSLEGVEYFKNLRELIGAFHPLTSLRLSENTALHFLSAWQNPLLLLDISGLSKIRHMDFDFEDNDIQVITDHRTAIDDDLLRYYAIRRSRKAEKE